MSDDDRTPRTARDALIIELLGDLGTVHDLIKNLPKDIDEAVSGSIKLVADAVEDAEKTALLLAKGIDAQKNTVIRDIDQAVKNSLEKHTGKIFSGVEQQVNSLQHKISSFDLADPKGRRLSFTLVAALIIVTLFSAAALYGIYAGTNSKLDDLYLIIKSQDAKEKRGLAALPPKAREQYQAATQTPSN